MTTITAVKPTGTWTSPDGKTFYKMQISLSDGVTGQVLATTPDRWKEGDEVDVLSKEENEYGTKLKIGKQRDSNGFSYGSGSRVDRSPQIESQWAINASIAYLALRDDLKKPISNKQVHEQAKALLEMRDTLIAER